MAKPNPAQTTNTKRTIAEIMDLKKPMEGSCDILLHPEYQERLRDLERQLIEAKRDSRGKDISQPGAAKIQKEIDALMDEAEQYVQTFWFRDIGRKALDALARKHPPTKEQLEEYKRLGAPGTLEFNVDTFGPALVSAAAFDPEITVSEAETIFDTWGAGDVDLLFSAAFAVCRGRASIPLSRKGIGAN